MSINAKYRRITFEELTRFQADPDTTINVFFGIDKYEQYVAMDIPDEENFDEDAFLNTPSPVDDPERRLDIENEWQAVHFLLTEEFAFPGQSRVPPPLSDVVMGGTVISTIDVGYGPPRYLIPDEVHNVSATLAQMDFEELGRRFDVAAYNKVGGYPKLRSKGWVQEDVAPIVETALLLKDFYHAASKNGDAMLLWAD